MSVAEITTISTTLHYFKPPPDGSKPWVETNLQTGEHSSNVSQGSSKQVIIENVRGHESEYDLDTTGFLFLEHESQCKNFEDEATIKDVYYKESIGLIKKVTGANRVVVFHHAIRKGGPQLLVGPNRPLPPSDRVHSDHTPEDAIKLVHALPQIPNELVPHLLKHRFQIINIWRPINHPAIESPLTLCDYRSIDLEKDLVATTVKFPDYTMETFRVNYNPGHKWKYQRNMRPDEVVFLKCFDSRMDGKTAILAPHTAFVDPTTPEGAPLRESIELRALVFYDDLPEEA
ncbi:hypothetical protein Clacol_005931 [Clathrus columnatus]|uniref:Methyltransferase n=1 Tax=Clathrus columnatus TaxID=1419009 RepID=A0AAV5AID0_9AGAM|nr:hypothetical protein Clacol_005931 [Clathrus columnatus]